VPKGNWNDVLRLADAKTRAFLKPARAEFQDGHLTVFYDDKAKFHAQQISAKFDDLVALIVRAMAPLSVELITPEGRKKKLLARVESGQTTVVEAASPARAQPAPESVQVSLSQPETPQVQTPEVQMPAPRADTPDPAPRATSNARAFFEDAPRAEPAPFVAAPAAVTPDGTERVSEFSPEPDPSELPPLSSFDADHDVPLESAPVFEVPIFEAPPVSSWDDIGDSPVRSSAPRAPRAAQPRSSGSSVSVQQHPLYDEVQKLFPRSQVRAKGKVKAKTVAGAEEDAGDESVTPEV